MKNLLLFLFIILISCKNEDKQKQTNNVKIESQKSINRSNRQFILKDLETIEIISYPDRLSWNPNYNKLVKNKKLNIETTYFKDRITLNESQFLKVTNLLASDNCAAVENLNACFMPRHLVLFKDKKENIIAYVEICFHCGVSRCSDNLDEYQRFCLSDLNELMREFGIKYFCEKKEEQEFEMKLYEKNDFYE